MPNVTLRGIPDDVHAALKDCRKAAITAASTARS